MEISHNIITNDPNYFPRYFTHKTIYNKTREMWILTCQTCKKILRLITTLSSRYERKKYSDILGKVWKLPLQYPSPPYTYSIGRPKSNPNKSPAILTPSWCLLPREPNSKYLITYEIMYALGHSNLLSTPPHNNEYLKTGQM